MDYKTLFDQEISENSLTEGAKKKRTLKAPDERKKEILDAALKLFTEKGYSNTTIQDISDDIGISQGLCYRYFKSKAEIFTACSEYYAFSAVQNLKIPFDENMTAIQKLDFLLCEMHEYVVKSMEFDESFQEDAHGKMKSEVEFRKLNSFSLQLATVLRNIIEQGIEEKKMICDNSMNMSFLLANGMVFAFHGSIKQNKDPLFAQKFIVSLRDLLYLSLQISSKQDSNDWFERKIKTK